MQKILEKMSHSDFVADFIHMFKKSITDVYINVDMNAIEIITYEAISDTSDRSHYRPYLESLISDPLVTSEVIVDDKVITMIHKDNYAMKLEVNVKLDIDDTDILHIYALFGLPENVAFELKTSCDDFKIACNCYETLFKRGIISDIQNIINIESNVEDKHRMSYQFNKWVERENVVTLGYVQHATIDMDSLLLRFAKHKWTMIDIHTGEAQIIKVMLKKNNVLLSLDYNIWTNSLSVHIIVELEKLNEKT